MALAVGNGKHKIKIIMMMKKKTVLILILTVSINFIYAQNNIQNMRKLDIEAWKVNKYGDNWYFERGDTIVNILNARTEYWEEIRKEDEFLTINYTYSKDSGRLLSSYTALRGIRYGVTKEYDEKGNVIQEIDEDEFYPFSIEDLRKLILEKYNRDIYKVSGGVGIRREKYNNEFNRKPTYQVNIGSVYDDDYQIATINGMTGDILWIKDRYFKYIYDNGGVYREIKKKNESEQDTLMSRKPNWTPLID